jgi:hypothetical protein
MELFHLPLSEEAFQQFTDLLVTLQNVTLHEDSDTWYYVWNPNIYTSMCALEITQFTPGSGSLVVRIKESSSLGSYSGTDLAPENF